MSAIRVVILDFDGVVIESNDVKTDAFRRVFEKFPEHTEAMMAFHHEHVSVTRFEKFKYLQVLTGRQDDPSFVDELAAVFSRHVRRGMQDAALVRGAEAFLREITAHRPVYLASVTPEDELKDTLDHHRLHHWFTGVYGCPPWTKPGAIRDILIQESVPPSETLLVGDSAGDQRAARETGVRFVARNSGLAFEDPQPLMFADLDEIKQYVNGFEHAG